MKIVAHPSTIEDLDWYASQLNDCQDAIDHYAYEGAYELVCYWQNELMRWEDLALNYISIMSDYIKVVE